jgi:putative acyl-CoA dehydrogenase
VAKYWICKSAPGFIFEAMESLGGNGYVEESLLPRLYREGPVNAIWEGSGNVMCLDVLRALKREEESRLAAALARESAVPLAHDAAKPEAADETTARITVGKLALVACAAALKEGAPAAVAAAYMRTRLEQPHGALYGAADIDGATADMLLQRVLPEQ